MRWSAALLLAGCVAARSAVVVRGTSVSCGGKRVELPPSVRVLRVTGTEVIAASDDVALSVARRTTRPPRSTGFDAHVIEQLTDAHRPVYRIAYHDANDCSFLVVARLPVSASGIAVMTAVAGTAEPSLWVGSPRVPTEPPVAVLLRQRR